MWNKNCLIFTTVHVHAHIRTAAHGWTCWSDTPCLTTLRRIWRSWRGDRLKEWLNYPAWIPKTLKWKHSPSQLTSLLSSCHGVSPCHKKQLGDICNPHESLKIKRAPKQLIISSPSLRMSSYKQRHIDFNELCCRKRDLYQWNEMKNKEEAANWMLPKQSLSVELVIKNTMCEL